MMRFSAQCLRWRQDFEAHLTYALELAELERYNEALACCDDADTHIRSGLERRMPFDVEAERERVRKRRGLIIQAERGFKWVGGLL